MFPLLCTTNKKLMSHVSESERRAHRGVFIVLLASICVHTNKTQCFPNTPMFKKGDFLYRLNIFMQRLNSS